MRQHSSSIGILAIACGLLAGATPALAAAETWVSGTGTDAGNCPITAPCRTFAFAHTQTNNNGAINVLSSGNFGPLIITKPISIVADGVEAVINTAATVAGIADPAGIIVQAGVGAVVSLRGLTIDQRGNTTNVGILFASGAALHVHNSVIRSARDGIRFAPAAGAGELYIVDSVIQKIFQFSIIVEPTGSASVKAVLDRVRVENGGNDAIAFSGVNTSGIVTGTVRDSVSSGNSGTGIGAFFGTGIGDESTGNIMIDRSAVVNNNAPGIVASGGSATIRIGDSTVTGNAVGLATFNGGVIASYGTNKVNGNTSDGATPTPVAMK